VGDGLAIVGLFALLALDRDLTRRERRRDWVRALRGDLDGVLVERFGRAEDRLAIEERINNSPRYKQSA
jgi:hypothetical protein